MSMQGPISPARKRRRKNDSGHAKIQKGAVPCHVGWTAGSDAVEPDVVVIYGNVAQMLRIVNGYLYNTGNRLEISASGDAGLCSDTVAIPMITGKPHLAIPCNGGRLMSLPNQTEMACGIPFEEVEHILEGMRFTGKNVPVMYSAAWQHIDWEAPEDSPYVHLSNQKSV